MTRRLTVFLCSVAILTAACSGGNERRAIGATPTSPSAVTASALETAERLGPSTSGPMVTTGTRPEVLDFRKALETKYQVGLRRSASSSFVDIEGDAVWMSEYIRYRLSGCAHGEAVQRVMSMIDGNPPGAECGASPTGLIAFPPRNEVFAFRQQLETRYQQMGRSLAPTFVDIEGSGIWIQQYMYHRANACGHAQAQEKVFAEIDGAGVQAVCYVPPACTFYFWQTNHVQVSGAGGPFTAEVLRYTGTDACSWTATSDSSWLTITSGSTGKDRGVINYSVAQNSGGGRTGKIRVSWEGGSADLEVFQQDRVVSVDVLMFDLKESTDPTTVCLVKNVGGGPTTCSFRADPHTNEAPTNIAWSAVYEYYGTVKNQNASGTGNTFSFQESCNAAAPAGGEDRSITMTVTVTEVGGNVQTVVIGFVMRVYPC